MKSKDKNLTIVIVTLVVLAILVGRWFQQRSAQAPVAPVSTQGIAPAAPQATPVPVESTAPALEGAKALTPKPSSSFSVVIDYRKSLAQMIEAGGYDEVEFATTAERFPVTGKGEIKRELYLVKFDKPMSNDEIIRKLDSQGLRAATIEELLALGAKYRDEQLKYWIVSFGSSIVLDDGLHVPLLSGDNRGRYFSLSFFEEENVGIVLYRFLAARK